MSERYDLWIRGGTLYDGSGAPGRPGDVAIRRGRIAALGEVRGSAERVLDATGLRAVVVEGTLLREDGRDLLDPEGPLPGRVLRSAPSRDALRAWWTGAP